MKKWANVIGLLLVLAFTVPAYAQGPAVPKWIREYMAACPGCQLRFTVSGWMVTRPGTFNQYLLNEAAHMARTVGADPASGLSLVSPGNVGVAFYDALPTAQEAVQGSVEIIRQRSVAPVAPKYNPDQFNPPIWYNPFTKAFQYTSPGNFLFSLIAFNNYWSRVQRNLVGPVVN